MIVYMISMSKDIKYIEIANYTWPLPQDDIPGTFTFPIFGTNDIHGGAFPLKVTNILTNETYGYGGLEYMASYVKTLRKDWGNRFLWLDGGDQFQGAIEGRLSNGSIITDFFDIEGVNATAIGNHEFDFGQPYLYNVYKRLIFLIWLLIFIILYLMPLTFYLMSNLTKLLKLEISNWELLVSVLSKLLSPQQEILQV